MMHRQSVDQLKGHDCPCTRIASVALLHQPCTRRSCPCTRIANATHLNLSTKSSTTTPSFASAAAVPTSRAALRKALSGADNDSRRLQQKIDTQKEVRAP